MIIEKPRTTDYGYTMPPKILLADPHLEYTGDFEKGRVAKLVWEHFELQELARHLGNKDPEKLMHRVFPNLPEDWPWEESSLWLLNGTEVELWDRFTALAEALDHIPSGDDDVFDYWPNTMDMLEMFQRDLEELGYDRQGQARELVMKIYNKVKAAEKWTEHNIDFDVEIWKPAEK